MDQKLARRMFMKEMRAQLLPFPRKINHIYDLDLDLMSFISDYSLLVVLRLGGKVARFKITITPVTTKHARKA